jgi:hypothetical protein
MGVGKYLIGVAACVCVLSDSTFSFAAHNSMKYGIPDIVENIFDAEPWYLSNPISRNLFHYLETGYNLIRFDRIFVDQNGSYIDPLSDSAGEAFGHTVGILGDVANDFSRAVNRTGAAVQGFSKAEGILQCTSLLPVTGVSGLDGVIQMKHSWIQIGQESYGMPSPFVGVMNGPSAISSPDPFVRSQKVRGVVCTAVLKPDEEDPILFKKKYNCIARQLSLSDSETHRPPLQITYDAFDSNCVSAARFLTECAGGRLTQSPNLSIGTSVSWDDEVTEARLDGSKVKEFELLFQKITEIKLVYVEFQKKLKNKKGNKDRYIEGWALAEEQIRGLLIELKSELTRHYRTASDLESLKVVRQKNPLRELNYAGPASLREPDDLSEKYFGFESGISNLDTDPFSAMASLDSALSSLNMDLLRRAYRRVPSTYRVACENARLVCAK